MIPYSQARHIAFKKQALSRRPRILCVYCNEVIAMNSLELTSAITALANALACRLTPNELALVASILVQLGDTLATIGAQKSLCEEQAETDRE